MKKIAIQLILKNTKSFFSWKSFFNKEIVFFYFIAGIPGSPGSPGPIGPLGPQGDVGLKVRDFAFVHLVKTLN